MVSKRAKDLSTDSTRKMFPTDKQLGTFCIISPLIGIVIGICPSERIFNLDLQYLALILKIGGEIDVKVTSKMKMAVYIDEKANSAQGEALKKILSGQAGGFFSAVTNLIGENMGIRSVPIEFHTEGRRRWLSIPKLLELQIEGVAGGDKNRESVIVNPGFTVGPGIDPVIARSSKYTFNDYGMTWDNSSKNGFYSRFTYAP